MLEDLGKECLGGRLFVCYNGHKRNLHMVKMGEKYTCFTIISWIYSILNIQ